MNREAHEIVNFIKSKGIDLRIEGGMFVGDCPFCNKFDGFSITPVEQKWSCSNENCLEKIKGEQQWLNLFFFVHRWVCERGQPA